MAELIDSLINPLKAVEMQIKGYYELVEPGC
jgi:hypothetical protein